MLLVVEGEEKPREAPVTANIHWPRSVLFFASLIIFNAHLNLMMQMLSISTSYR